MRGGTQLRTVWRCAMCGPAIDPTWYSTKEDSCARNCAFISAASATSARAAALELEGFDSLRFHERLDLARVLPAALRFQGRLQPEETALDSILDSSEGSGIDARSLSCRSTDARLD